MPQIPTPPASRPGSEAPEVEIKPAETPGASTELLQSLDILLEQYLHLLDQQQELQSGLAKQLSSGFLALAHANYTCPPGRRYGADYYDERMKATRKISVQRRLEDDNESTDSTEASNTPSDEAEYQFNVEYTPSRTSEEQAETKDELQSEDSKSEKTSNIDTGITTESDSPVEDSVPSKSSVESKAPKKSRPSDPIYWYGILVPPSLRTAQKSFTDGIQNEVPALAAVVVKMRGLEDKINKIRTELGS
ncbi:hypothetical protein N7451_006918 [Penicillium sp. IBT 35674x]|nr:hypothetical protein N7451_006918 [Penicillium sp. IBT 35674x]